MRPRVILVAPNMENPGGQAVQARSLADELAKEGYEVALLAVNPRFPLGLRWLRRVPLARTLINQALYLPSLWRLRHADVVHVFSASYWSFLLAPVPALSAGRWLGKRVVLNYHSGEAEDHLARWRRWLRPFLRLADEIVVPSEYLQKTFGRHGYRTRVLRNVVDTSRFRFRERSPLRPRLICTRSLEANYRVGDVLEAFAVVCRSRPEATLTLAGTGAEERRLRALAAPFGDRVQFVGRVEPAAMPALLDGADLFVNASVVDNQPVSILEAFAAGLAVVSTAAGGIPSLIRHDETGLLVPLRRPDLLAAAILDLLEHPARAADLARRARQEVDAYSWRAVRRGWEAVYVGSGA